MVADSVPRHYGSTFHPSYLQSFVAAAKLSEEEKANGLGPWVDVVSYADVPVIRPPDGGRAYRALELSLLLTSHRVQRALLLGQEDVTGRGPKARGVGATFRRKYVERFRFTLARLHLAGVDFELQFASGHAVASTEISPRVLVLKGVSCQVHFDCRRYGAGIGAECYRSFWKSPQEYVKNVWPLTRPVGVSWKKPCAICGNFDDGFCSATPSEIGKPAGLMHLTPALVEDLAASWGLDPVEDMFRTKRHVSRSTSHSTPSALNRFGPMRTEILP